MWPGLCGFPLNQVPMKSPGSNVRVGLTHDDAAVTLLI